MKWILWCLFLFEWNTLLACTGIKLTGSDGSFVHGRTLEFGIQVDTSVVIIPRGYEFVGTTPKGEGLKYVSKYGVVGVIAFKNMSIMDGINEKGLAVGTFYFPGYASYAKIDSENQSQAVSPVEFSNWILTQFATINEVKAALPNVFIAPTIVKEWGNTPAPFHYIIYDKSGNSLVIEPLNGQLIASENPLGILTNSPTFEWHMTNLRNYINLTPINVKPLKIHGIELAPFGQGSGMVGLPGDFTPPSRFIRAAIFVITATPPKNAREGILQAFHLLNQFDIPVGLARETVNDITYTDSTQITCVRDPQALKYYFKTYEDQNIKVVDLSTFDLESKKIKLAQTSSKTPVNDISSDFSDIQ